MASKPTYEELAQRISELEKESAKHLLAEADLRESNNKLRLLTDNSPAYLAYVGADDLCYQYVNERYYFQFNSKRDQCLLIFSTSKIFPAIEIEKEKARQIEAAQR